MAEKEVPSEIKDMHSDAALNLLQTLLKDNKITPETAESFKRKFVRLTDTIVSTFQNHKAKKLKNDLNAEKIKSEQASNKQMESLDKAERINSNLRKADAELEIYEKRLEQANVEYTFLEQEKSTKLLKIQEEQKEAKMQFLPIIERYTGEIEGLKDDKSKRTTMLENETKHLLEQKERISNFIVENEKQSKQAAHLYEEKQKIKEDPKRHEKGTENLRGAIENMRKDLDSIVDEIGKKDRNIDDHLKEVEELNKTNLDYENTINLFESDKEKLDESKRRLKEETQRYAKDIADGNGEKVRIIEEIRSFKKEARRYNDNINSRKKAIEHKKKEYKKEEKLIQQLLDLINEQEISKKKYEKEEQMIKKELEEQEEQNIEAEDKITEIQKKINNVKDYSTEKTTQIDNFKKEIKNLEKEVVDLQNLETNALKTIKDLTAQRESMARKASSANAEVRETREELKIKDLIIQDLKKKHQEVEQKLYKFKALYEEAKGLRNKYVNLIQNSSQDLAELKERIKILQNELEIQKNETAEKDRTLLEYKHLIQLEIHRRDGYHAMLNKLEYVKKQKNEIVEQNINETSKLNMVILSLEKEMLSLRKKYELACEDRNYTGIQLINRNDELCILYEKANIQENIIKNGESEIKRLDNEIRMIKIEISDMTRKINVSRKGVDVVPKLADNVVKLKNELDIEKERERKLTADLEDPVNQQRWRDLKGEDPEQEALEAKIQVLEERLNSKKETLLEKELILDEISNLSEKLRKQALDGRQTTLQLSEQVNSFQARLKEITRKMMCLISELSMFQAMAIKLGNERDRLDDSVLQANKRVEENLPPYIESEVEFLKTIRNKKNYEESIREKRRLQEIEKNIPPFATKTTAIHRVNAYIPDEIGLPRPYGKHAPFVPNEPGSNMRHIRKPEPKEIEI